MARFKFKITGLDKIKKQLNVNSINQEIDEEFEIYAEELRSEAVILAPVDTGILRAGIESRKNKQISYDVIVNAEYGPFVEFGTRMKVKIDPEMTELASQFIGYKISTGNFKESILQWMRNKGISEEYLLPIMAKIMKAGINPQPFLTPAYKKTKKNIEDNFDKTLNRILNERR